MSLGQRMESSVGDLDPAEENQPGGDKWRMLLRKLRLATAKQMDN
jgi:hypothetical protein